MRVAFVHDYIKEYGGAERVLETLHEMYPDAPVYTLVYAPQFLGPHKNRFKNWDIRPSWLQYIPFTYKFISIYRLIAPWVFRSFDFSKFDVVIVSATGAYSPNCIRTRFKIQDSRFKKVKQICYCHTPPRYLYGYATAREQSKNPIIQAGVAVMCHILRMVDFRSAQNVDVFIANSKNVAQRIDKFYRRKSEVIYPPVNITKVSSISYLVSSKEKEVQNTKYKIPNTNYYLCGGRLARPKHIDLIIRACKELKVPLKIFGRGFAGYEKDLHGLITDSRGVNISANQQPIRGNQEQHTTIEFLGEVDDKQKLELMSNAKAFIFAAEDEDFGIVPVEAMGQGTSVIAYKSGGVLETVIDPSTPVGRSGKNGATGIFFDELTVESLKNAIKKFEALRLASGSKLAEACYKQAQKFSKEQFVEKINELINSLSSRT